MLMFVFVLIRLMIKCCDGFFGWIVDYWLQMCVMQLDGGIYQYVFVMVDQLLWFVGKRGVGDQQMMSFQFYYDMQNNVVEICEDLKLEDFLGGFFLGGQYLNCELQ